MADDRGSFKRLLQIILDTKSAEKTKQDAQRVLEEATRSDAAKRNLNALGTAWNNVISAINRKIEALRVANDEQKRMAAATRQGADEVNALKVALAGEQAARKLNIGASEEQTTEAIRLAQETERLRQETEQYTDAVNEASAAQKRLDAEMERDTGAVEELRRTHDEQQRMTAATLQGADAVDRLKVTLAGEAAVRRLSANATEAQRTAAIQHAEGTERERQAQVRYNAELNKTTVLQRAVRNIQTNMLSWATGFFAISTAIFAARRLIEWADGWKLIQGRLKLVTSGAEDLQRVTVSVFDIAQRTRTSYEAIATLFQRVAFNARELGRSQAELLDFTETVTKSMQLVGATPVEARAGVIQLSQALASGVLRGDEFRSMMENLPGVASALARGLDVPVGKLREMAFAGELTAQAVVDAILKMKETVDEEFKTVPVTMASAWQVFTNELMKFVGTADKTTGATSALAESLLDVAAAISLIGEAFVKTKGFFDIDTKIEDWFKKNITQPMREAMGFGKEGEAGDMFFNRQTGSFEKRIPTEDQRLPQRTSGQAPGAEERRAAEFEALMNRLGSDRTEALVKFRAAKKATVEQERELNDLFREGNRIFDEGNLKIEDQLRLLDALNKIADKDEKEKTAEQLLALEDKRIAALREAHELDIQTADETEELLGFAEQFSRVLKDDNSTLEERVRASQQLAAIWKSMLDDIQARPLPTTLPLPPKGVELLSEEGFVDRAFEDAREAERERRKEKEPTGVAGFLKGTGKVPTVEEILGGEGREPQDQQDRLDALKDNWLSTHEVLINASEGAAQQISSAWQSAFQAIALEGEGLGGFMQTLFGGMAAAVLGGLSQIASTKMLEQLALGFGALGSGWAQAFFNPAAIATGTKSAGFHFAAAGLWGAIAGGAGAASQAASGGGGGGGAVAGSREVSGRTADRTKPQPIIINNYFDPLDPRNGRFQTTIGNALVFFNERRGRRITGSHVGPSTNGGSTS